MTLPSYQPVAELTPSSADGSGVAHDSAFTLTSLTSIPAAELAGDLTTSPDLELTRAGGDGLKTLVLRPKLPLAAGAPYRFTLAAPDGTIRGSWVFRTKQPLHVVTTLPGDETGEVPVDTGIEVIFDQAPFNPEGSFSIAPAVRGRFERHERTLVFVPEQLRPSTVYTVTIKRGVRVTDSDQRLEQDAVFAFETAGPQRSRRAAFSRLLYESSTKEAAIVGVEWDRPRRLSVLAYRFPDMARAIVALERLQQQPTWTSTLSVDVTKGLPRVASFFATGQDLGGSGWFTFPDPLPFGWYVLVLRDPAGDSQAILQVTDLATWAGVLTDRTVVWVNDATTGRPRRAATVVLADPGKLTGESLGRTDAKGLLIAPTPAGLSSSSSESGSSGESPAEPTRSILVVRSGAEAAFVPLGLESSGGRYPQEINDTGWTPSSQDRSWQLLYTDRLQYRPTDTIHLWGLVRDRATGRLPQRVTVRLTRGEPTSEAETEGRVAPTQPAIAAAESAVTSTGGFALDLTMRDLPESEYTVELWADGRLIARRSISVRIITKPAFRFDVRAKRNAVIAGDVVEVAATATFYDGTPVPGLSVLMQGFEKSTKPTTTALGVATGRFRTEFEAGDDSQFTVSWVSVAPARAEEADISAQDSILVFRSSRFLTVDGSLVGRQLSVAGAVNEVDLARLDREYAPDLESSLDPRGAPIRGATASIRVFQVIPIRRRTGSTYDFITKRVIPTYEYSERLVAVTTRRVRARADGTFVLRLRVPSASHAYRIRVGTTDAAGRTTSTETEVARSSGQAEDELRWYLASEDSGREADDPTPFPVQEYSLGEQIRVVLRDGRGPLPSGGISRYLFLTERLGLQSASIQSTSTLVRPFQTQDVPGLGITAVRFTGRTYQPALDGFSAKLRLEDRALRVTLTSDARRYEPGGTATVVVQTTDQAGQPVAATVTVRVIDQKLFDIGGAEMVDPLADLYASVATGLLRTYASHLLPIGSGFEGGDTTGGGDGDREDFRDWLFFGQVDTDEHGRAQVSFRLSDDLTSWRVDATAWTRSLLAGQGSTALPVGLPFFVDATIAPQYLTADRPMIRVRAFGGGLTAADRVTFVVRSDSLGLAATTVTAPAFGFALVELPPLRSGMHRITIAGSATSGAQELTDSLTRSFEVVESRHSRSMLAYTILGADFVPSGGPGITRLTFSDAGRGTLEAILAELVNGDGARVDQALAAARARGLLSEVFQKADQATFTASFQPAAFLTEEGAVALFPYAGGDLHLSALAAIAAPEAFNRNRLVMYFREIWGDPYSTAERRWLALAGLAAIGEPVLDLVHQALEDPSLSVGERLLLALGALALGDEGAARSVERDLLASAGQRLGGWLRLQVDRGDPIEATALLAALSAGVGDLEIAAAADRYVHQNPPRETLLNLYRLAYVARALPRTPAVEAAFSYTIGGVSRTVDIGPGQSFTLELTPAQMTGFSARREVGAVGVITAWQERFDPSTASTDPGLHLTRTVEPDGPISAETVIFVRLQVNLGPGPLSGCYLVTDLVPSGLAPVSRLQFWPTDDPEETPYRFELPYEIVGQRVHFCVVEDPKVRVHELGYFARVVTPGVYRWEPAIVEAAAAPEVRAITPAGRITVR